MTALGLRNRGCGWGTGNTKELFGEFFIRVSEVLEEVPRTDGQSRYSYYRAAPGPYKCDIPFYMERNFLLKSEAEFTEPETRTLEL